MLFGVVQDGADREMRARCAEELPPLGFDGCGFGGWRLTPEGELADETLEFTAQLIPDPLPRFALAWAGRSTSSAAMDDLQRLRWVVKVNLTFLRT